MRLDPSAKHSDIAASGRDAYTPCCAILAHGGATLDRRHSSFVLKFYSVLIRKNSFQSHDDRGAPVCQRHVFRPPPAARTPAQFRHTVDAELRTPLTGHFHHGADKYFRIRLASGRGTLFAGRRDVAMRGRSIHRPRHQSDERLGGCAVPICPRAVDRTADGRAPDRSLPRRRVHRTLIYICISVFTSSRPKTQ